MPSFKSQEIGGLNVSNNQVVLKLPVAAHIHAFEIFSSNNITNSFSRNTSGFLDGFKFSDPLGEAFRFYRLKIHPVSSNDLVTAIALNRLAYGPTPDELTRVQQIGPQAYIDEQLQPEKIVEDPSLEPASIPEGWEFYSITQRPAHSEFLIGLDEGGAAYVDDITLVKGAIPAAGPNLIRNGDFESPLGEEWVLGRDHARSRIVTNRAHTGNGSLLIQGEYNSISNRDFIAQNISTALDPTAVYTLSFWHYRQTNRPVALLSRVLEGGLRTPDNEFDAQTKLAYNLAVIEDLRAHHVLRAVKARRQLLEVLLQFLDNHFVTAISKNYDYFGSFVFDGNFMKVRSATNVEFKELQRWRQALLRPDCTFHDLLRISAESLSMIFFLDTFSSSAAPGQIPNENYARELLELFTFGVDNGYDQKDVETLARVWTGWRVNMVDPENEYNLLAPRTKRVVTEFEDSFLPLSFRHNIGVFTAHFVSDHHDPSAKVLFPGKTIPARFGPPYSGRSYELALPYRPGTNGLQDGYDVLAHLAKQPFTQEFISVKLCRLFVHDNFEIGYDFTDPSLSPEGKLVARCMQAWERSNGQIREVLRVIFDSSLFRSSSAAFQKVKTSLEFVVSAIRALRTPLEGGSFSSSTDGYSMEDPLNNMGNMNLFDREQPDGFPETAKPMVSVGLLAARIRWIQAYLSPPGAYRVPEAGQSYAFPSLLIKKKLPREDWHDAGKVADALLSILYPGAGEASMGLYRTEALKFLNLADDGVTPSSFARLSPESEAYDLRVRGLVSSLMALYHFNEQ